MIVGLVHASQSSPVVISGYSKGLTKILTSQARIYCKMLGLNPERILDQDPVTFLNK